MTPYYQDAHCTIYHGDCREVVSALPTPAAVITDPPYGYSHASGRVAESTTAEWMNTTIAGDGDEALRDACLLWAGAWAVFGYPFKSTVPAGCRAVLVWDKGPASGMGDLSFPWKCSHEVIYVGGTGWKGHRSESVIKDTWVVSRRSMGREHPNQKSESVMTGLVAKAPAGLILDPFMGSGTTLRAAKDLGRNAIGIEIEERYCEIAAKRLAQEVLPL